MSRHSFVACLALAAVTPALAGAECVTQFDLTASRGDALSFSLALPLAGTFIGNYDAVNNPSGTRTRLGLFGGSGNNPISYSASVKPGIELELPTSVPTFIFCLQDEGDGTATVSCVVFDLLGGAPSPIDIDLTITYPNFNTQQPTAVFPGVSDFTLSLPAGEISLAQAVQTAPVIGTLVPTKDGSFILTALVPADLSFQATVLGQLVDVPPTPITLPIVAELVPSLLGDSFALLSIEIPTIEQVVPTGGQTIDGQPVPLPTLLPPGGTANLLVSGTFGDGIVSFGLAANLSGEGQTTGPTGDLNGDCIVNGSDLAIVLGSWGPCADCAADLTGDGVVDGADLAIVLGNWS